MPNKAPDKMTGEEALLAYGFQAQGDRGLYAHPTAPTDQMWVKADGGWIRLDKAAGVQPRGQAEGMADPAAGAPWGRPWQLAPESGLIEVPHRVSDRWQNVSGLHPLTHGECFDWVWPDSVVAELYAYAYKSDRPAYKRITEGKGAEAHDVLEVDPSNKLGR